MTKAFSSGKKRGRNNDNNPRRKKLKKEESQEKQKNSENSGAGCLTEEERYDYMDDSGNEEIEEDKKDDMVRRDYFFTLNNYTPEEMAVMDKWYKQCKCMQVQQEIGPEKGTPHLQGYVYFKNPKKRKVMFNEIGRGFWCKPPKNGYAVRNYCDKEKTRRIGEKVWQKDWPKKKEKPKSLGEIMDEAFDEEFKEKYANVEWRGYQQFIINLFDEEPDDRTVWWFWDGLGNTGKSFLAAYIRETYGAFQLSGRMADCTRAIAMLRKVRKEGAKKPKFCIYDIPRGLGNSCSYTFLEDLKNQFIFSTKNDSEGMKVHKMHVVVFANQPPMTRDMSMDRWKVYNIAEWGDGASPPDPTLRGPSRGDGAFE